MNAPNNTSWVFGKRLRDAGLLGSMGRFASSVDNCLMESFFSTLQRELLDTRRWDSRVELGSAIFEWIEAWYNPRRRHTALGNLSPADFEHRQRLVGHHRARGVITTAAVSGEVGWGPALGKVA